MRANSKEFSFSGQFLKFLADVNNRNFEFPSIKQYGKIKIFFAFFRQFFLIITFCLS